MIRTALIASFALSTFAFAAPADAKTPRDKAVEACITRTAAEMGDGKAVKIRTKRQRSGYKVSFTKYNADGAMLGKVTCKLSKGKVVEFASTASAAKAR